jgi:Tfp pilus assembly protein PilZ
MTTSTSVDRRQHERFRLSPMYSPVTVQHVEGLRMQVLDGHAYDVSESGVRLELDQALQIGERVALLLQIAGEERGIGITAQVVWVNPEEDDPGPRRMAMRFLTFSAGSDRRRLIDYIRSGLAPSAA